MTAPLTLAALLCARLSAGEIEPVPALVEPVSAASPVVAQLRLDLAALRTPLQTPELPPSAVLASPASFANLQQAVEAGIRAKTADVQVDALRRVELAQQVLGRFDPNTFAKLPQAEQESALTGLWNGWKNRGLVASPQAASDPAGALDRLITAGVEDRALTSANKSVFLAAGVLGYPLEDSLWLLRTRITDALEENNLRYPDRQRWTNADHTPEILGTTREAQDLVDAWGAATEAGRKIVERAKAGSRELPQKASEAAFARVVFELVDLHDHQALAYLSGEDPTFSAFLLDARKPGYYLYNGDQSIVARIMKTKAAAALGVRRLDKPDGDRVHASTYFYRPARVAARLRELGALKAGLHDDDYRRRLGEYGDKALPLAASIRK